MARKDQILTASALYVGTNWETNIQNVLIECFEKGADWADEHPLPSTEEDKEKSPWISVDDDLPCNHEELISLDDKRDTLYVVAVIRGHIIFSRMRKLEGKWFWENDEPTHWFPIPKSPK